MVGVGVGMEGGICSFHFFLSFLTSPTPYPLPPTPYPITPPRLPFSLQETKDNNKQKHRLKNHKKKKKITTYHMLFGHVTFAKPFVLENRENPDIIISITCKQIL